MRFGLRHSRPSLVAKSNVDRCLQLRSPGDGLYTGEAVAQAAAGEARRGLAECKQDLSSC